MGDRARRYWPYALYAVLSVVFCLPLFAHPNGLGINDWDQHLFYYGSVLKSVVEYGQLPFWNPWYCGGNVLWQNPQVPLLSPVFPLSAVFSIPLAMKINIVLHYFIGFVGMHLLLVSAIGVPSLPVVIYLAIVANFAGAYVMHLGVGHSVFLPCFYLPLQLYFVLRANKSGAVRDVVAAAALFALMIYNGALHVVPMSVAAIGLFSIFAASLRREWRPLVVAASVVAGGFAYSTPKLIPVVEWVTSDRFVDARTVIKHPDQMTAEMVLHTYLDRYQNRGLQLDMQRSRWHEYGNYIGAVAAVLIVGSIAWVLLVRGTSDRWLGLSFALTSIVLLLLSMGEFSAWAPASIANHIPFFSSFRIPSRYTIVFVLFGIVTVAWVVRGLLSGGAPSPSISNFVAIVCVLASADLVVQNRTQLEGVFALPPLEHGLKPMAGARAIDVDTTSSPYTPDSPMFRSLMNDRAFFQCYESLQTRRVATPSGPLIEADDGSKIFDVSFSPNRVRFSVAGGREPSHVVMNQNFAPGWRSDVGPVEASPDRRQPMVTLQPGQTGTFAFTFVPPGLVPGLIVLALSIGATIVGWKRTLP